MNDVKWSRWNWKVNIRHDWIVSDCFCRCEDGHHRKVDNNASKLLAILSSQHRIQFVGGDDVVSRDSLALLRWLRRVDDGTWSPTSSSESTDASACSTTCNARVIIASTSPALDAAGPADRKDGPSAWGILMLPMFLMPLISYKLGVPDDQSELRLLPVSESFMVNRIEDVISRLSRKSYKESRTFFPFVKRSESKKNESNVSTQTIASDERRLRMHPFKRLSRIVFHRHKVPARLLYLQYVFWDHNK